MIVATAQSAEYVGGEFKQFGQERNIVAFVNEQIPAEQRAKLDPSVFHKPWGWNVPIATTRWTVDRERNVFLIRLGGGGPWEGGNAPRPREYMVLSLNGQVIKFEVVMSAEGTLKDWVGHWEVLKVDIPPAIEAQRTLIMELIREGLQVMANPSARPEGCTRSTVSFHLQSNQ